MGYHTVVSLTRKLSVLQTVILGKRALLLLLTNACMQCKGSDASHTAALVTLISLQLLHNHLCQESNRAQLRQAVACYKTSGSLLLLSIMILRLLYDFNTIA